MKANGRICITSAGNGRRRDLIDDFPGDMAEGNRQYPSNAMCTEMIPEIA